MLGGESVDAALDAVISGKADAIVVLENDLYARVPAAKVDAALAAAKVVIVADHSKTATVDRAHLVLPAASFAEGDGTLVSQEGRAQRFFQVFDPQYLDAASRSTKAGAGCTPCVPPCSTSRWTGPSWTTSPAPAPKPPRNWPASSTPRRPPRSASRA
jgi:NADH-quinone oxidoreductase subunit G